MNGLGTSEILVILGVGILFFGPEALKGFAKEAGKAAGDLKEVPKAFQDGMESMEAANNATPEAIDEPKVVDAVEVKDTKADSKEAPKST